ncbi:MAG: hypothetical protein AAGD05_18140 [Bacteroidota bacterium]
MLKGSVGVLMIGLIVASLFVPVEIPYTFDSTAKVYPLQQWVLQKNRDGSLLSTLHDYRSGLLKDYASFQFDRGDLVSIQFNPGQIAQSQVDSGTLIAAIGSNMLSERLIRLDNDYAIEQANLQKALAGKKPEIIQRAEEELRLAEQELLLRKKQYERAKEMHQQGLLAFADYEQAEGIYQQTQTRVGVVKDQLAATTAGEKPEQINFIRAKIASIAKEKAFLEQTSDSYQIYAPIGGQLSYETTPEADKLIVEDTTAHILYIPVKLRDRDFLGKDTKIELSIIGQDSLISAQLIDVSDKVEIINRNVVVVAKASVSGKVKGLSTGMPVKCKISCGQVKPMEYMKRSMKIDLK